MSTIPTNDEATKLLNAYHLLCLSDHTERASLSKLVTAYNKKNPLEKLKAYHLIQRSFPTAFNYILNKYKKSADEVFENKFTKIFYNLNVLPSAISKKYSYSPHTTTIYSKLSPYMDNIEDFFHKSYHNSGINFKEIISGDLYEYVNKYFINIKNPSIKVKAYNLCTLSLFIEV